MLAYLEIYFMLLPNIGINSCMCKEKCSKVWKVKQDGHMQWGEAHVVLDLKVKDVVGLIHPSKQCDYHHSNHFFWIEVNFRHLLIWVDAWVSKKKQDHLPLLLLNCPGMLDSSSKLTSHQRICTSHQFLVVEELLFLGHQPHLCKALLPHRSDQLGLRSGEDMRRETWKIIL